MHLKSLILKAICYVYYTQIKCVCLLRYSVGLNYPSTVTIILAINRHILGPVAQLARIHS